MKTWKHCTVAAIIAAFGFIVVFTALFLTGCEQPTEPEMPTVTLTGITLNHASVKKAYYQNEQLNLSGLIVTAVYSDGTSATVTSYTASPANGSTLATAGTKTVTISYTEGSLTKGNSFNVNVAADITYGIEQTGGASNTADSTGIVFTFSTPIDGLNLTAADIVVDGVAAKDTTAISGTGTTWALAITVSETGLATVSINKLGIEGATKTVTVHKAGQVTPEYWTITWHLNGGAKGTGAYPEQILKGAVLTEPTPDPAKDNNTFGGWYTDAGLTQTYNFTNDVTTDLNLYAKWETVIQPTEYWTITWHLNGGTKGTGAYPEQIVKGTVLAEPTPNPAKDNNTFGGWYADTGLTQTYNFVNSVTGDLNLYAKWNNGNSGNGGNYDVIVSQHNYDANGNLSGYTEYEYDSNGKSTKNIQYGANGNLSGYTEYEYDSNENTTKRKNYDANGNLSSEYKYDDSNWNLTKSTSFPNGQYSTSGYASAREEYEYDSNGNQTKVSLYVASGKLNQFRLNQYRIYVYKTIYIVN